jgi:hypothetical protein
MADVVSAIRSYLLSRSEVTDVIGQRMYLDRLPQGATLPAATIEKTSSSVDHLLSNVSGFIKTRLAIRVHATRRLDANAAAHAMYLDSRVATVKGLTHGVDIRGVMVEDGERNYVVEARDGSDDHEYVTEFDLMVGHKE